MNKKIIILIIAFIILIPSIYFATTEYLHNLEEQTFYDGIKEISDIENKTDSEMKTLYNQDSVSTQNIKDYLIKSVNTTTTEINLLEDLKNKVSNESYIEYMDIQINRLNCENRTYTALIDNCNTYLDYLNGKISNSKATSLIEDKNKEIETYSDKTGEFKVESDTFLSTHTDMKIKFNSLGIDEDFLYEQIENVEINRFTK